VRTTPDAVASADIMRSVPRRSFHHGPGFRPPVGFCTTFSLCRHCRCFLCFIVVQTTSTFLPSFPRPGFASPASRGTAPQQYYGGSDSCPHRPKPAGLSAYSALPSAHPAPNHVMRPERRFDSHISASGRTSNGPGFAINEQARRRTPPKRVRYPAGCAFASGCSPPRLAATQLPSASCVVTSHDQDSHSADKTSSRTHSSPGLTR
jgi:hypothetical protein